MKVLVTGAGGFIGRRVHKALGNRGAMVIACDIDDDILSDDWVQHTSRETFDRCIHLAAHKYATTAEDHPARVAELNIRGTANVVDAAGCPVVLASTCKAADPCTVYGASKLIAERIVLNAGGVVLRLVNVLGSTGSVLRIWAESDGPIAVTDCERMWIDPDRAVRLFIQALDLPPGRYGPLDPPRSSVAELARRYLPSCEQRLVPLRRGDRPVERLVGEYETAVPAGDGLVRILDRWES